MLEALPTPRRRALAEAALVLGLAVAALIVFRGALGYYFSQDDFGWIAQARGLIARTPGPWRSVSMQFYFRAMSAVAGLDSTAWHATALLLHIVNACLLHALFRRHVTSAAAWAGAVFFAVHPALFTAIYWTSAIADVLALGFALAALVAFFSSGWQRWLAVPLLVLSLLSKESTILLPFWLVAFAGVRRRGSPEATGGRPSGISTWASRFKDPVMIGLLVATVPWTVALAVVDVFGARGAGTNPAYAVHFDRAMIWNLLTYLGWTANFLAPTVHGFADATDPKVYPWGLGLGLFWAAGLLGRGVRERGWLAGGALFLTFLLPVLPLANHTYHYYLYAPLAGAAWCVAALVDRALATFPSPSAPAPLRSRAGRSAGESRAKAAGGLGISWAAALVVAALLTWNGALLVAKVERYPFVQPELRADPTVDRAIIARNVVTDLSRYDLDPGTRLSFWFPRALAPSGPGPGDPTRETYWERNVKSALYDGLGVRVANPRVGEVRFVNDFRPESPSDLYAVYRLDGHLNIVTAAQLDSLIRTLPGAS